MNDDKIDDLKKEMSDVRYTTSQINEKVNDIKLDIASHVADFREQVVTQKHMQENLSMIAKALQQNTDSLIEHMARTKTNEVAIEELKNISINIDKRLSPLEISQIEKNTINKIWKKIGWAIGTIATLVSFVYTIFNILSK